MPAIVSNFTPIFNITQDMVHYNITYTIANQPPGMTTPIVWILCVLLGVGLLLLSALLKEGACMDLSGILSSIFLLISSIQAFAVDTVSAIGVTSSCVLASGGNCSSQTEWVLMESHVIYHYELLGFVLAVVFLISLANLYRIWTDYRRITNQPEIKVDMPNRSDRPSQNHRRDREEEEKE